MTKLELLTHAARRLGDASADFITNILKPEFEIMVLELLQAECIVLELTATFTVKGTRGYDLREICGSRSHAPRSILSLIVYAWGDTAGFPQPLDDESFARYRAAGGEERTGRWERWRVFPRPFNLEVYPPAGADELGAVAQIVFTGVPQMIPDNEELSCIAAEDQPAIIAGLVARGAEFGEDTLADAGRLLAIYEEQKSKMWARAHNSRPGRIVGQPF